MGGIGPEATGEFYLKLISEIQKRGLVQNNGDYPQIVINSINAPELIGNGISECELKSYENGLRELDKFGVDFIVMVCNTIHIYYEILQKTIGTRIINLREIVRDYLTKSNIKNILIIGTPSTIRQGLYLFDGISSFQPDDYEIQIMSDAIFCFNKGEEREKQKTRVMALCNKYLNLSAEMIILGCTEFAVMLDSADIPKINTIDLL